MPEYVEKYFLDASKITDLDAKPRADGLFRIKHVPASFRSALASQNFQGIIAFRSLTLQAIEGFGMDRMEKLSQQLDRLDLFSEDQQDWASSIFADAQQLAFDSDGRITLHETLREHAQIDSTVAFIGRGPTFQLWNPDHFKTYQEKARERLRERKHTSLGSIISGGSQ